MALTHPLHLAVSGVLALGTTIQNSTFDLPSGSTVIATGTLANAFTIDYTQVVNATEMLAVGCVYSANLIFTIS